MEQELIEEIIEYLQDFKKLNLEVMREEDPRLEEIIIKLEGIV